jgi:hypothetical protein
VPDVEDPQFTAACDAARFVLGGMQERITIMRGLVIQSRLAIEDSQIALQEASDAEEAVCSRVRRS